MTQIVPLNAVPSQKLSISLGGQVCLISVYQKSTGMFLDLTADDKPIVLGVVCQNQNRLVRYSYLGFAGDLVFFDAQGSEDPAYAGLGTRWLLAYLTAEQLAALGYSG